MKKSLIFYIVMSLTVVFTILSLPGCGKKNQSGGTIDEPEITVDYLYGEYRQQLERDGAEHILGSIDSINVQDDGIIALKISGKEIVESDEEENGYYIADTNVSYTIPLGAEARTTFIKGPDSGTPQIKKPDKFVSAYEADVKKNGKDDAEYAGSRLYDMYSMSGQIELILAKELE